MQPLIELGVEMIRRGHEFSVMAYEAFRPLCEAKKVPYIHEFVTVDYSSGLKRASDIVHGENGCRTAADKIEKWF